MKTLHLMSNTIIWFMDTTGKHGEFKNQIIQAQVIHRPGDTVQYRLPKRITHQWVDWEPTDLGELYELTEPLVAFSRLSHRNAMATCIFFDHYREIGIVGGEVEITVISRDYNISTVDRNSQSANDPSCIQYLEVFPETARSLVQYLGRRETRRIFTMCNQSSEFFTDQFVILGQEPEVIEVTDPLISRKKCEQLADHIVEMMEYSDILDELKDRLSKEYEYDIDQFVFDWKLAFGNFKN